MLADLRNGCRSLLRSPGFTAANVLTLGVGTGATIAVLALLDAVLAAAAPAGESGSARRGPERARCPRSDRRPRRDRGRRPAQGFRGLDLTRPADLFLPPREAPLVPAADELPCRYRHRDRRPGVLARELESPSPVRSPACWSRSGCCRWWAGSCCPAALRLARWTSNGPGRWWLAVWLRLSRQHFVCGLMPALQRWRAAVTADVGVDADARGPHRAAGDSQRMGASLLGVLDGLALVLAILGSTARSRTPRPAARGRSASGLPSVRPRRRSSAPCCRERCSMPASGSPPASGRRSRSPASSPRYAPPVSRRPSPRPRSSWNRRARRRFRTRSAGRRHRRDEKNYHSVGFSTNPPAPSATRVGNCAFASNVSGRSRWWWAAPRSSKARPLVRVRAGT